MAQAGTPQRGRTAEQIREHYLVERELAARLRASTPDERRRLYTAAYDEMFRRVPHHPMLVRKEAMPAEQRCAETLAFLAPFLRPDLNFLEIGPGDCALSVCVARRVKHVWGVDVSTELTRAPGFPPNFELLISDGTSIPTPPGSVDLAFSNQLMEHLHPDDALEQLRNIHRALAPGGRYICLTPNRVCGPHDVSRHFDDTATCFHLKEYTAGELATLFAGVGFRDMKALLRARGRYLQIPPLLATTVEQVLDHAPHGLKRRWVRQAPGRKLLACGMVATK